MPSNISYPGVYVEELPSGTRTVTGVATALVAFVGKTSQGPVNQPTLIHSYGDFERIFGGLAEGRQFGFVVQDFFLNGGSQALIVNVGDTSLPGSENDKTGLYALEKADLFTLLCIPQDGLAAAAYQSVVTASAQYCQRRRALLVLDAPADWTDKSVALAKVSDLSGILGNASANAAVYFPWIMRRNPLEQNQPQPMPPCGAVAGLMARTDAARGIWKAPAGTEAALVGAIAPSLPLTNDENGELNPRGCNCIRALPPYGTVVWGARTLDGDDDKASQWKYVSVRRLALYLEESLYRATQWVVFEPNDEPLWSQIRLNIGAFLHDLFRRGAFQGSSPKEAYFVKCDRETTTQTDIDQGKVNVIIGFAPLKPAEFVILKIQQVSPTAS